MDRAEPDGSTMTGRLPFLDGLRGWAAVYVLLHHACWEVPLKGLPGVGHLVMGVFRQGHYAVAIFIVLSGFCLTRPLAADDSRRLRGGFLGYLGRRARRILPPYYAALGFAWALIALIPALRRPALVRWDAALPAGTPGVIVSHLALIHNLSPRWIFKVDPPLWSVATEWQIYLVFPLLLAIWRRAGIAATVASAFVLGTAVTLLGHQARNPALIGLSPWYLGLFALGMAAAAVAGRPGRVRTATVPWAVVAVLAVVAPWVVGVRNNDFLLVDPIVGVVAMGLIVRLARRSRDGDRTRTIRALESGPSAWFGSISYSLYLTHFPILSAASALLRGLACSPGLTLAAMLLVASPVSLLVAGLFARVVERPFATAGGRDRRTSRSTRLSPAEPTPPPPRRLGASGRSAWVRERALRRP